MHQMQENIKKENKIKHIIPTHELATNVTDASNVGQYWWWLKASFLEHYIQYFKGRQYGHYMGWYCFLPGGNYIPIPAPKMKCIPIPDHK